MDLQIDLVTVLCFIRLDGGEIVKKYKLSFVEGEYNVSIGFGRIMLASTISKVRASNKLNVPLQFKAPIVSLLCLFNTTVPWCLLCPLIDICSFFSL